MADDTAEDGTEAYNVLDGNLATVVQISAKPKLATITWQL